MTMNSMKRDFILGDSWLYYKIYTGPKTSDTILTQAIKPVAERLLADGIIDKWFFIRYADPKHHLRVRFHCVNPSRLSIVIASLYSYIRHFIDQDLIWKVQTDTYQREIERYGRDTMELSEELFFYDSRMIVGFIDLIEGDEGEELRWLFALRIIDHFLRCFGYADSDKLRLMDRLKTNFGLEFGMSRPLKKQLDSKYRTVRTRIEEFMTIHEAVQSYYAPILKLIAVKDENLASLARKIKAYKDHGKLEISLDSFMASHIHMTMNRLFISKNRVHEMVCYDFLWRHYKSKIARDQCVNVCTLVDELL